MHISCLTCRCQAYHVSLSSKKAIQRPIVSHLFVVMYRALSLSLASFHFGDSIGDAGRRRGDKTPDLGHPVTARRRGRGGGSLVSPPEVARLVLQAALRLTGSGVTPIRGDIYIAPILPRLGKNVATGVIARPFTVPSGRLMENGEHVTTAGIKNL